LVGFHPVSETEGLHPTFKITKGMTPNQAISILSKHFQKSDRLSAWRCIISQNRPKKRIRISGTDSLATASKKEETLSHNIDICQ